LEQENKELEVKKPKLIESEIIDIDGERIVKYGNKSYRIKLFKGRNSYRVLTKLTKYGSSVFGGVLRGVAESGEDVDASLCFDDFPVSWILSFGVYFI